MKALVQWQTALSEKKSKMFTFLDFLLYLIDNNYSPKWRWLVLGIYRGREAAR